MAAARAPRIRLPKSWNEYVRSAVLHVLSLAQFSLAHARGRAAYSLDARVRWAARYDRLRQENAQLREEVRIKDARMARIEPRNRPHYPARERLAILLLRSARGWSLEQTAKTFRVTKATIAFWNRRLREDGAEALVSWHCASLRRSRTARQYRRGGAFHPDAERSHPTNRGFAAAQVFL